ncbi:MAG: MFS transporter [Cyanobacteria bacterium J06649_4]
MQAASEDLTLENSALYRSQLQQTFQAKLDSSSLTRPMWMLWILSAGLIALDGFDFFVIGVAMPFIRRDFGLSAGWVGAIATAALVGALVGSLTLGPITDRVGRQRMLIVDIGLFIVASLATALAWNAWSLLFFRFLVGVGIGADYPISVAYITENTPARFRGRMVIGAFSFQAVGAVLGAVVGWLTLLVYQRIAPELAIEYAWRWMLGVGVVLSLVVGGLRLLFQLESPSYHLAKGEYQEAAEAASQLLGQEIELQPNLQNCQDSGVNSDSDRTGTKTDRLGYRDLFSPRYRQQSAIAAIPWFLQDIATYGIGIFTPTIITAITNNGSPPTQAPLSVSSTAQTPLSQSLIEQSSTIQTLLTQEIASARGAAIVNVFLILGFLFAILFINRIGRIPLQITGFVGMALGLIILSFAGNAQHIGLLFAGFILFNFTMNLGPNATTFLLSGEVFPPAIRASGAGLASGIAKAGAVLGALGLPIIQATVGLTQLLQGLALICLLAAAITYGLRQAVTSPFPAE